MDEFLNPSFLIVVSILAIYKVFEFIAFRINARSKEFTRLLREEISVYFKEDFTYNQLSNSSTIRLLLVEPGALTDPIRCIMEEASLDRAPIYNALSYAWKRNKSWKTKVLTIIWIITGISLSFLGSLLFKYDVDDGLPKIVQLGVNWLGVERPHWILCNGKRIQINENLYDFLIQLRQSGVTEKFWIDALCINQANLSERNAQVKLMPRIYKSAVHIIVWLGPCPSLLDSEKIMGRVSSAVRLSHLREIRPENGWLGENFNLPNSRGFVISLQTILKVFAQVHVLTRSYFERAWIIQEILLADSVTFWIGRYKLRPEQLVSVADTFDAPASIQRTVLFKYLIPLLDVPTTAVRKLLNIREEFRQNPNWKLADYITVARSHYATEDRDLIFAGLGLIAERDPENRSLTIEESTNCKLLYPTSNSLSNPDYSVSMTELFVDSAEILFQEVGLFALSLGGDDVGWKGLPSWVPHFGRKTEPFKNELGLVFSAGGDLQAEGLILPEYRQHLLLSGAEHLDYVLSTHSASGGKHILDILTSLTGVYKYTGEPEASAFARTLIADCFDGQAPASSSVIEELIEYITKAYSAKRQQAPSDTSHHESTGRVFKLLKKRIESMKLQLENLEVRGDGAFAKLKHTTPVSKKVAPPNLHIISDSGEFGDKTYRAIHLDISDKSEHLSPIPDQANTKASSNSSIDPILDGTFDSPAQNNFRREAEIVTLLDEHPVAALSENAYLEKSKPEIDSDPTLQEFLERSFMKPGMSVDDVLCETKKVKFKQEKDFEETKTVALQIMKNLREHFTSGNYDDRKHKKLMLKNLKNIEDLESKLRMVSIPEDSREPDNSEPGTNQRPSTAATRLSNHDQDQAIYDFSKGKIKMSEQGTDRSELQDKECLSKCFIVLQKCCDELTETYEKLAMLKGSKLWLLQTLMSDSSSLVKVFTQRCENRCFFITEKGYMGLGSISLEKGDSIKVISGAYVPFAMAAVTCGLPGGESFKDVANAREEEELRRKGSVVTYRLKGEVYVHGIMYGERTRTSDWSPRPIILE